VLDETSALKHMPRLSLGKGHDMKNVRCPKVDQNKRFSHMVRLNIMLN